MSEPSTQHAHAAHAHHQDGHGAHDDAPHFALGTYLVGFALASFLTILPFWLVMAKVLSAPAAAAVIIVLAVVQILVHTACFLHVNSRIEGGWTLVAGVFTAVIVVISIIGSLWIMYHLHLNMMPMAIQ